MSQIKKQIKKYEDRQKALKRIEGMSMNKIYENGEVQVWQETNIRRDTQIFIQLTSSVHWTPIIKIRWDGSLTNEEDQWTLSYGSGGTIDAKPAQIAEAMQVMFARARHILENEDPYPLLQIEVN